MVKLTDCIDASMEWTGRVLFNPFEPKKWLILIFTAYLAGYIYEGLNLNYANNSPSGNSVKQAQDIQQNKQGSNSISQDRSFLSWLKGLGTKKIILLVCAVFLLLTIISLFFLWLSCRFAFIFLENTVTATASVKAPFKRSKKVGNSLFSLLAVIFSVFIASILLFTGVTILIALKNGFFERTDPPSITRIIMVILPLAVFLFLTLISWIIFHTIVNDFVVPVMYKKGLSAINGLKEVWAIIKKAKFIFAKYLFVKLLLSMCGAVLNWILSLAALIGLILPAGAAVLAFYLIYLFLPKSAQLPYFFFIAIVCLPILGFLLYCLMGVYLPVSVFLRTFSIKFLSRVDEKLNLFSFQ